MNKKGLAAGLGGYVLWGLLPLYWGMLSGMNSIFVLCMRILGSAVFTFLLLVITKKHKQVFSTFKDKQKMKYLVPAAIAITINWGLYIWMMSAGKVLEGSLGYYINPLAVFLCGVFVFKERCERLDIAALILAAAGVVIATVQLGKFPFEALILAASFATYGTLKKFAKADSLVSVCVETLLVAPIALLYIIFADASHASLAIATPLEMGALLCAGIVTALPLILYSQGVNTLSLTTMGFLQYICPTLMLGVSYINGEDVASKLLGFAFIWAGLIIFSYGLLKREREAKKRTLALSK
ncbi:EamA family transporter RarD [Christensenellaceae bacterium OttesenSCG-928-M15]|nr:EamA family transporter RarD [Christensenellaceae bacterium OttesenSCG-928-M15]